MEVVGGAFVQVRARDQNHTPRGALGLLGGSGSNGRGGKGGRAQRGKAPQSLQLKIRPSLKRLGQRSLKRS